MIIPRPMLHPPPHMVQTLDCIPPQMEDGLIVAAWSAMMDGECDLHEGNTLVLHLKLTPEHFKMHQFLEGISEVWFVLNDSSGGTS